MKFTGVACAICGNYVMHSEGAKFFQVKEHELIAIECKDQPWTGVRTICNNCIATIKSSPKPKCTNCNDRGGWEDGDEGQWVTCAVCCDNKGRFIASTRDDNADDWDNDRPFIDTRPTYQIAGFKTLDDYCNWLDDPNVLEWQKGGFKSNEDYLSYHANQRKIT